MNVYSYSSGGMAFFYQLQPLAAGQVGVYIYSNQANVNGATLVTIYQDGGTSTDTALYLYNDGLGHALNLVQNGVLNSARHAFYIYSNVAQTSSNSYLFNVWSDHASSTGPAAQIRNDGTGHGLVCYANGVLAASRNGLQVYTNSAQVNSYLLYVQSDNASSTYAMSAFVNDGSGIGLYLKQNGSGNALWIDNYGDQYGCLVYARAAIAASYSVLKVYSHINQTTGANLFAVVMDGTLAAIDVAYLQNAGSGMCLNINQTQAHAAGKATVYIYDSGGSTAGAGTVYIWTASASHTDDCTTIVNQGTGHGLRVVQNTAMATGKHAFYVVAGVAQTSGNSQVMKIQQNHSGSTNVMAYFLNEARGTGVQIDQNFALNSSKYSFHIYSNTAQTNSNLFFIWQDHASSTITPAVIRNDGTNTALYLNVQNASNTAGALYIQTTGTGDFIYCYKAAAKAYCQSDGDWYNVNGTYGTISDRRLKKDIEPGRSYWGDLKKLKVQNYTSIISGERLIGQVADEVAAVFPGLVSVSSKTGYQAVRDSVIYGPIMLRGLQENMGRTESLEIWKIDIDSWKADTTDKILTLETKLAEANEEIDLLKKSAA